MPRLIRSQPLTPTQESASGVWSLGDAFDAVKNKTWPIAGRIVRSLRFNDDESSYLNRTPPSAGNRKTWTWSGWVKRGGINVGNRQALFSCAADSQAFNLYLDFSSSKLDFHAIGNIFMSTNQEFRDPSAWYHIVFAVDTTQATASNRWKLYINGEQVTSFATANYPNQNANLEINSTAAHNIARNAEFGNFFFDGYLAEITFVDGQALGPESFGETRDGVWSPIDVAGLNFGTNGFYLKFNDRDNVGKDVSGNGNNWTTNNLFANDILVESVEDNFCTWNPLIGANFNNQNVMGSTIVNFANGNLVLSNDANTGFAPRMSAYSTLGMRSGKWYSEHTNLSNISIGIAKGPIITGTGSGVSNAVLNNLTTSNGSGGTAIGTAPSFSRTDVLGIAFDADNSVITFYKNGVEYGSVSNITADVNDLDWFWVRQPNSSASGSSNNSNFGQQPFVYGSPAGYLALSTANLPEPTVVDGGEYFNTVLYTGTEATQSITGVGFQPDLVWFKSRSGAFSHFLVDQNRGNTKYLSSNVTDAETTNTNRLTSFDSDGFTLGDAGGSVNGSGVSIVAWNWRANGAGSTNTDGTITSTVSANTTSGFSIVTWTGNNVGGATVGHGLGVAPSMLIVKSRGPTNRSWGVYHSSIGNTGMVYLDLTNATNTAAFHWNNTSPTSTVFTLGNGSVTGSAENYVAYCWAEISGYSKFGSYTGNGSTDGPFVYTGFRPAWVMMKRTDNASQWFIVDTARNTFNIMNSELRANASDAESSNTNLIDCVSNGFKIRHNASAKSINESSGSFIYMAFAETPFKYSRAR
jgi:hypothetical protein